MGGHQDVVVGDHDKLVGLPHTGPHRGLAQLPEQLPLGAGAAVHGHTVLALEVWVLAIVHEQQVKGAMRGVVQPSVEVCDVGGG